MSPAQYLGDAAVGDLEYPGDITGPGTTVSQLHDLLPGGVRQGPPGHEHPAQLVDPAVACSHQSSLLYYQGGKLEGKPWVKLGVPQLTKFLAKKH